MKTLSQTMGDMGLKRDLEDSLKKSYNEALQNADFKKFVSKIKLSETELIKYTSQLETSFNEYQNCLNCKSILECKNQVPGYAYLPKISDNKLQFSYTPCAFQKKLLKDNKYQKNIFLSDVPKEIKEASMAKIYTDDKKRLKIVEWLTNFMTAYKTNHNLKGLYLSGSFGSGKTYLIAAMFNELAKENIKSAIVYWPEFLRGLKGSFNTDFNSRFDQIKHVPLLLIDDMGAENTTAWGRDEILGPIMQYRMQEQLPTFLTSNLTLKELEQHFSVTKDNVDTVKARRIIERIEQLTDNIELISKNLRK